MDAVNLQGIWVNFPASSRVGKGSQGLGSHTLSASVGGGGGGTKKTNVVHQSYVLDQIGVYEKEKEMEELVKLVLFLDMV